MVVRVKYFITLHTTINMTRNLLIYMILCIPWMGITQIGDAQLLTTDTKDILMVAGTDRADHFGYVTSDGLTTVYNGTKKVHNQVSYTVQSQNYSTLLKGNIKTIACNTDGRIYVNTLDNHILMFEEGKVLAGLPLKSTEFHQDWQGDINTVILYENNWYAVRMMSNPLSFQARLKSDIYPEMQTQINEAKPQQISINEIDVITLTAQNNRDIIMGYESGHEMKWHKIPSSALPCEKIVDLSQAGPLGIVNAGSSNYQVYAVGDDGVMWVMTKKITSSSGFEQNWTAADWSRLGPEIMGGKVKSIHHAQRVYALGHTDATQNAIFAINANKKITCFFDLPGNTAINHLFYSPYEELAYVATGKQVYQVSLEPDKCQAGISSTKELSQANITIMPNPSPGAFDIILPVNMDVSHLTIIDMQGKTHYHRSDTDSGSLISTDFSLSPGMYILQLTDSDNNTHAQKLIIH